LKRAHLLPLLLCACAAPEGLPERPWVTDGACLPTGAPAPNEVRVNASARFQTMDGVGANAYVYPVADDLGWSWHRVRWVFPALRFAYVRTAPWFRFWEDPNDHFGQARGITRSHDLPFARYLAEQGAAVELGVWDVADWMAGGKPRQLRPGMGPELGESVAAYVEYMAAHGISIPVVEVQNEPDIAARVKYPSPEALRDAAVDVLDALDARGLTQVDLHGPNLHAPPGTVAWGQVWFAEPRLAARTAAVSYHAWWSERFEDFDAIRRFAASVGKPVWAAEVGYCPLEAGCFTGPGGGLVEHPDTAPHDPEPTRFLRPETWATAWDTAGAYHRAIAWSGASRVYHWAAVGHGAFVSKLGAALPTYWIVAHFARAIPPGARFIDSAAGDPALRSLAFLWPDGARGVVLLNAGPARSVRLTSVGAGPGAISEVWVSTAAGRSAGEVEAGRVHLPAESVVSLVLR
jgi:O-glycosyl hydrolase